MRGRWVVALIVITCVAPACRKAPDSAPVATAQDWWYEIAIEKPIFDHGGKAGLFKGRQGLRIFREGRKVTLAQGGQGVDQDVPPVKLATHKVGAFWMHREPGEPWEVSPDEPISRQPNGRNVVEHFYGELISALGGDAVGPVDYPEVKTDVVAGESWPFSVLVGTRHNERRVAMLCTLKDSDDGLRIEFVTVESNRQKGAWTLDAKGELVAYESEQQVIASVAGAPERTSISKVTVMKKWAPQPIPPPRAAVPH